MWMDSVCVYACARVCDSVRACVCVCQCVCVCDSVRARAYVSSQYVRVNH